MYCTRNLAPSAPYPAADTSGYVLLTSYINQQPYMAYTYKTKLPSNSSNRLDEENLDARDSAGGNWTVRTRKITMAWIGLVCRSPGSKEAREAAIRVGGRPRTRDTMSGRRSRSDESLGRARNRNPGPGICGVKCPDQVMKPGFPIE